MAVLRFVLAVLFVSGCYDLDYDPSLENTNNGPTITIASPTDGGSYTSPLVITGVATDEEDGDVSSGIVWNSGDRLLGTGASIMADFEVGPHLLMASVTDSHGLVATKEISITITSE